MQSAGIDPLFEPIQIRGLTLRNRIVMAPMGRRYSISGLPSEDYVGYYRRRAIGGVALITSEATPVPHPASANSTTYSDFSSEAALSVWKRVADAVHEAGSRYAQQLCHVGGLRMPGDSPNEERPPISPSGLYMPPSGIRSIPVPVADAASESDVADVVSSFARGAASAAKIGCDAINIHGAHGFLLDQFLWSVTNRREDSYGLFHRTKIIEEIIKECRRAVGNEIPIILRLSQWKQQDFQARLCESPRELEELLRPFVDAGLDIVDCSTRRFWEPEFEGSDLNLAGWAKKLSGLPSITVGSVGLDRAVVESPNDLDQRDGDPRGLVNSVAMPTGIDQMIHMLARGDFDLVAVGRALISNPFWPTHVRNGDWGLIRPFRREHLDVLE